MLGGSESTVDLTCGRRETIERCGEQPQGPRRKCARQTRSQGKKGRTGRKERNTLHVVFHFPSIGNETATATSATTAAVVATTAAASAEMRLQ